MGDRNSKRGAQSRVLKIVDEGPGLGLGSKKTLNTDLGELGTELNNDECSSGV